MPGNYKRLERQFQTLEGSKEQLLKFIKALPEDIYLLQPSKESWSIAQAANHIFLSEKLSFAYLRKKLSYPDQVPKFNFKSWGAVLFLKFTLWTPYKAKAPKTINMWEDQVVLSSTELESEWTSLRSEMKSFIRQHYPSFSSHLAYRHPFAGRMTMHQMLIFFNDHMKHHIRQMDKILVQLKSMEAR